MKVNVFNNPAELGENAAAFAAELLNRAIAAQGGARLLLSTGASQFDTLKALVKERVDWEKVTMFHLDEYVGLPETHPASFRRYLKERFINHVKLKEAYLINTEGDLQRNLQALTAAIREAPIDVALIGIGENSHIAFNDPPADFDTKAAYAIVNLNERCQLQQVNEGWFPTVAAVPKQAVSITVYQILQSRAIISCVPHRCKAEAIRWTLEKEVDNEYPATILKTHAQTVLFLDVESASLVDGAILEKYR
jgi:glucosamine-6-phosphate deaminase